MIIENITMAVLCVLLGMAIEEVIREIMKKNN